MALKVEAPPRVTPFRVFLRELKKKKLELASCALAAGCVLISTKLVSLKKDRVALDAEHEERMTDLQADNKKLRSQLQEVQERVMNEAGKSGRRMEPLPKRLGNVFDEIFPQDQTSEEFGKKSGKFFV